MSNQHQILLNNILSEYYNNPTTGLLTAEKFWRRLQDDRVKCEGLNITLKQVKDFLATQKTDQVFHQRLIPQKLIYPIRSFAPFARLMVDLMEVKNEFRSAGNPNYIFICLDVFTRYVWAFPMQHKDTRECVDCFTKIIRDIIEISGNFIAPGFIRLTSDNESALMSREFRQLCDDVGIKQVFVMNDYFRKATVERFIRTLRRLIKKYIMQSKNLHWITALDDIIENYNNTYHSTIKTTPVKAIDNNDKYVQLVKEKVAHLDRLKLKSEKRQATKSLPLKIGSYVRILRKKKLINDHINQRALQDGGIFKKEDQTWSNEVYKITGKATDYNNPVLMIGSTDGYLYKVGLLATPYRRQELLVIPKPSNNNNESKYDVGFDEDNFNPSRDREIVNNDRLIANNLGPVNNRIHEDAEDINEANRLNNIHNFRRSDRYSQASSRVLRDTDLRNRNVPPQELRCQAITESEHQCFNKAVVGQRFCSLHLKMFGQGKVLAERKGNSSGGKIYLKKRNWEQIYNPYYC